MDRAREIFEFEGRIGEAEIVEFEPEHGEKIFLHAGDPGLKDYSPAIMEVYGEAGPAYSAIVEDRVLLCAGIMLMWPGVGTAWAVVSPLIEVYPIAGSAAVMYGLQYLADKHKLHRIQAPVYEKFERGIRWVEFLGFKREGLLTAYGRNKENYIMYAYVKESD